MRTFSRILTVCFVVLIGVGCKKGSPPSEGISSGTIRIGEVGTMTGSDAAFGESTHRGILLAIAEINAAGGIRGRKLELITLDDQGKPSEAVLAMTKLIKHHRVRAVLGEVASTLSIAMAPIAQQFKIPMISPSSINSKVTKQGDFVFRVCFVDSFQSRVMAEFASNRLKAKRVAILRDVKSDYSQDSAVQFIRYFTQSGGEVAIDQSYSGGDVDFKSQLTAIRSVRPDLIVVPGYYTEIGLIARQSSELGIHVPLLGGDGWDSPKLVEIGGKALAGSYFVSHFSLDDPATHIRKFVKSFQTTFGGESPNGLAALGYDAASLLADALLRSEGESEGLRKAIAATRDFKGVTGKISINSDRNADKTAVVFKILESGALKAMGSFD